MKVDRPAPAPVAPPAKNVKTTLIKYIAAAGAILGLIGVSFEMYLYFSPEAAVSHAPSPALAIASVLFFIGGIFVLNREK